MLAVGDLQFAHGAFALAQQTGLLNGQRHLVGQDLEDHRVLFGEGFGLRGLNVHHADHSLLRLQRQGHLGARFG